MGAQSDIEWTDASYTPIRARNRATGKIGWHCEPVSPGCEHCYSEGFNCRLGTGLPFKPGHRKDVEIFLDEKMLLEPLQWKKPKKIFPCSMTDLFANFVPDAWIDKMFAVMALASWHTFQPLTKRSERMRRWANDPETPRRVEAWITALAQTPSRRAMAPALRSVPLGKVCIGLAWPLPNVWLGVSAEDQCRADERVPDLLATPAAVRFVSAEPLLGPIDFTSMPRKTGEGLMRPLDGRFRTLDWIIVGGESGRDARPMSIQWAREIRDQCAAAEVPFFFKQWGEWTPARPRPSGDPGQFAFGDYEHDRSSMIRVGSYPRQLTMFGARAVVECVGKKAAGRLLDGVEHSAFPEVAR